MWDGEGMSSDMASETENKRTPVCPLCGSPLVPVDVDGSMLLVCEGCFATWADRERLKTFLHTKRDLPHYVPYLHRALVKGDVDSPLREGDAEAGGERGAPV